MEELGEDQPLPDRTRALALQKKMERYLTNEGAVDWQVGRDGSLV
jgi:hypothetical protein